MKKQNRHEHADHPAPCSVGRGLMDEVSEITIGGTYRSRSKPGVRVTVTRITFSHVYYETWKYGVRVKKVSRNTRRVFAKWYGGQKVPHWGA